MPRVDTQRVSPYDLLSPSLIHEGGRVIGLSVCIANFSRFNIKVYYGRKQDEDFTRILEDSLRRHATVRVELSLEEKLVLHSESNLRSRLPAYLELSVSSYRAPRYCIYGIVIASSENTCPVIDRCSIRRELKAAESDSSCPYYRVARSTFLGLYKVFVDRETRVYSGAYQENPDICFLLDVPINGEKKTLLELKFGQAFYIDEVVSCVRLERQELRDEGYSSILLFPSRPKPMRRIVDVPILVAKINMEVLRSLLERGLLSRALPWLKFKYTLLEYLSSQRGMRGYFSEVVLAEGTRISGRDIVSFPAAPYRRGRFVGLLDLIVRAIRSGAETALSEFSKLVNINDEKFIKYVAFVLLNSIAHVLVGLMCAEHGAHPTYFGYWISVTQSKPLLVLYERCTGGLGHVHRLRDYFLIRARTLGDNSLIIQDSIAKFLRYGEDVESRIMRYTSVKKIVEEYTKAHGISPEKLLSSTRTGIRVLFSDAFINNLRKVCEIDSELAAQGVYLPAAQLRRALMMYVERPREKDVELYNYILDNYEFCFDGCTLCLIQDKLSPFTPDENMYLVSKSLLKNLLELSWKSS